MKYDEEPDFGGEDPYDDSSNYAARKITAIEVTAANANELLIEYFSIEPYSVILPDKDNKKGKSVRVPCDVPTIDGFCASYNITPTRLSTLVSSDTRELCMSKFKNIMLINGLNRGYDAGFGSLVMKNEAGYSEKSENKEVREMRLLPEDIRILAEMKLQAPAMKVIEHE